MGRFEPYTHRSSLPTPGTPEDNVVDFKGELQRRNSGQIRREVLAAKVAAFANADGGTLLVGARENKSTGALDHYEPLSPGEVKEVHDAFSEAVRDYCCPPPVWTAAEIPYANGVISAINVWPFPGQVVGVRTKGEGQSFSFPMRSGVQTVSLRPEQFPMLMIPELRRVVTLLRSIPLKTAFEMWRKEGAGHARVVGRHANTNFEVITSNELENIFVYCEFGQTGYPPNFEYHALDRVETAFKKGERWTVYLK